MSYGSFALNFKQECKIVIEQSDQDFLIEQSLLDTLIVFKIMCEIVKIARLFRKERNYKS